MDVKQTVPVQLQVSLYIYIFCSGLSVLYWFSMGRIIKIIKGVQQEISAQVVGLFAKPVHRATPPYPEIWIQCVSFILRAGNVERVSENF